MSTARSTFSFRISVYKIIIFLVECITYQRNHIKGTIHKGITQKGTTKKEPFKKEYHKCIIYDLSHWAHIHSFFLQEHLIRLPIIVKNTFEYHKVLGNCSCVLSFSSCITCVLITVLSDKFGAFVLSDMLLMSLWKVFLKETVPYQCCFERKTLLFAE